jgi:hypothetical protein
MKNILLLSCLLLSGSLFAQKPTGGCGYTCRITGIAPGSDPFTLYNGTSYAAAVQIHALGCEPVWGQLSLYIDTMLVGSLSCTDGDDLDASVSLSLFHFAPGTYALKLIFWVDVLVRSTALWS